MDDVLLMTKEQLLLQGHAKKCLDLSLELQKDLTLEGKGSGFRRALKARWNKSSVKKHAEELLANLTALFGGLSSTYLLFP
jgi:hypothetical protein